MKCVFFDRDGIVNAPPGPGYVERWEDFVLLPGFVRALQVTRDKGYGAVVITNQRGVARGIMTQEELDRIHGNLRKELKEKHGLELLDIFTCVHERDTCECRKPKPGMLLAAAQTHGIDLAASWMIGDREGDIEAGQRAGCRTILVSADGEPTEADFRIGDMDRLAAFLEEQL